MLPMSAVPPIADKRGCGWIVRFVPIATDAPQQSQKDSRGDLPTTAVSQALINGLVGPAEQKIGFHRAFTFDVDASVRLEPKVISKVSLRSCRDLYTVWQTVRLHTTGDVHRVTPDVVDKIMGA